MINEIFDATGLSEGIRHPATFILEAADDIIYLADDIEDGVKKGVVPWEEVKESFLNTFKNNSDYLDIMNKVLAKECSLKISKKEKNLAQVRIFRNIIQGYLIRSAISCFFKNYELIMNGQFGLNELLKDEEQIIKWLKNQTKEYCFSCEEVLSLEVVGEKVMTELLNTFEKLKDDKLTETEINDTSTYVGKIYSLISENYKVICRYDYDNKCILKKYEDISQYSKTHMIVDFISGMTDSYAVNLYKKLVGISLPE